MGHSPNCFCIFSSFINKIFCDLKNLFLPHILFSVFLFTFRPSGVLLQDASMLLILLLAVEALMFPASVHIAFAGT